MQCVLVITASGPVLALSTHQRIDDPGFVARLHEREIDRFIAYEVPLDACRRAYGFTYRQVAVEVEEEEAEDVRFLDLDGHHIFAKLSLLDLGRGIIAEDGQVRFAA